MNLGRQQQDRRKKWMCCCGQRFRQKQVDHNLKVAVPMTTCTVMAAETVEASILTGILDLMIG